MIEIGTVWMVELCDFCHPSNHHLDCEPVVGFLNEEEADAWVSDRSLPDWMREGYNGYRRHDGCYRVTDYPLLGAAETQ